MKAILVGDMPEDCSECILRGFSNEIDDPACCVNGFPCDYSGRPDWCPLRPLPEKQEYERPGRTPFTDEYVAGWNACLNEITGGSDETPGDD